MSHNLTQIEIMNELRTLGVKKDMMLEVHCSLCSFGYVEGGANTVIHAIQQTIGNDGALVMPSFQLSPNLPLNDFDKNLGLSAKIKILNNDEEKSAMGIVSDTFRKMPDVITGNGIFRVSAWGKEAGKHAYGFQHLIDSEGYALLLGVDIYKLSAMHYVESDLPAVIKNKFKPSKEASALYPENEWFIEAWTPAKKPWYTIQQRAYEKDYIRDGLIGKSKCMFFKVKDVVELYREALQSEPLKLFGLE